MTEFFMKIFKIIKILSDFNKKYFIVILLSIFLLGGSFFVLPLSLFETLQIENFRSSYFEIIGIITYISALGMLFLLIIKGCEFLLKRHKKIKILKELTLTEQNCLRIFIMKNSQTHTFSLYDGIVAGLVEKGLLHNPGSKSNKSGDQDFNIYPWVYKYLENHNYLCNLGFKNDKKQ